MDLTNPPERYWHCIVELTGEKRYTIVNDLTFVDLQRTVVHPWLAGRPFTVAGTVIRSSEQVGRIRIVHTPQPQETYAQQHNAERRARGIADMATDRRTLPFGKGEDLTFQLLFEGGSDRLPEADVALVERLCGRLPQAARNSPNERARGSQISRSKTNTTYKTCFTRFCELI